RAAALGGLLDRSDRLLLRGALGIVTAHPHSIPVVESASAPGIAWKWLLTPWRLPNGLETPSTNRLPFAGLVQMAQWLRVIIGLYERGHPHPVGHRARRPAGRRAAAAAGLRRTASTGGREAGPGAAGQALQATVLVHEAYLRLVDVEKAQR